MEVDTHAGIFTDRKFALAADALAPVFKKVVRMLGKHTSVSLQNIHKATKKRIPDLQIALCAGG
jgi:hypothetical protein